MAQNRNPPTRPELDELKDLRDRATELEHALEAIKQAVAADLISLKGLARDR